MGSSVSSTLAASSKSRFRAPRAIFWTALGLRLAAILIGHTYRIRLDDRHFDFGFEAGRIAESLVTGQGYGNPFNGHSGPTAWLPPLYPLLMALAFRLFGIYTRGAALFLLACNSVFSALIAPAVYEIAARCFDAAGFARRKSTNAAPVALWSAWLWAVYPAALQYAVHWIWEMSLSACLFAWALVIALRLRGIGEDGSSTQPHASRARTLRLWAGLGLIWGLIALSNASLLLVFAASVVWIFWPILRPAYGPERGVALARNLGGVILACAVFAAVLTPWVLRNERALGTPVLTRSNFGVELWQSTHFDAYGAFPWGTAMPLWPGDPEFRRYVSEGEVAYAREKGELAKQRLRARPGDFAKYTVERAEFFWIGTPHPTDKHPGNELVRLLNYSFLSLAGLMGLALMLRNGIPGAGLLASVFVLVPLVYYAVTVQARFRHPIEPLIAILGVYLFRSADTSRVWSWR